MVSIKFLLAFQTKFLHAIVDEIKEQSNMNSVNKHRKLSGLLSLRRE